VIAYGLTIPANAPHPEAAELFIRFLLGEEGKGIMAVNHHPLLENVTVDNPSNLPVSLQPYVETER
jgi:ABC-type Fe3+ transport system substrate-binding protein